MDESSCAEDVGFGFQPVKKVTPPVARVRTPSEPSLGSPETEGCGFSGLRFG